MKVAISRVSGKPVETNGDKTIVVNLSTLEDLTELMNKYGDDLIISNNKKYMEKPDVDWEITIFDDYVS